MTLKPGTALPLILRAIETDPNRTPDQIAKAVGLTGNYVRRKCKELYRAELIHITDRSIVNGAHVPHYTAGPGEDAPMLPLSAERRAHERKTGQKIASTTDMPGHNPIIDPWSAKYLGIGANV